MAQAKPVHRGYKSRFIRAENPKPRKLRGGQQTYATLRGVAMRLIDHLEQSLPHLEERPPEEAAGKAGEQKAESKEAKAEGGNGDEVIGWTDADYQRLLGRNGCVIDSFKTLSDLIVRLIEVEAATCTASPTATEFTEDDEKELDRRIAAELDRLAERRGPAKPAESGLLQPKA